MVVVQLSFPTYRTEQQAKAERFQSILSDGQYQKDDVNMNAQVDACQSQKSVVECSIYSIIHMLGRLRNFGHLGACVVT